MENHRQIFLEGAHGFPLVAVEWYGISRPCPQLLQTTYNTKQEFLSNNLSSEYPDGPFATEDDFARAAQQD
eukprot:930438-Karenia_brevis.AAC.1